MTFSSRSEEIEEELIKLSVVTKRVIDANDEYRTDVLVDMESKSDGSAEVLLDDQLEFEKVTIECEARFYKVFSSPLLGKLWARRKKCF
ncbi:hypothetical protein Q5P01_012156 [Channa striata]|uniref:Uncharacterized protein n=1 Tax=Channa striata TaxID=64152 RepID=A0AA88SJY8_CHASR|nr:hypothetical protein Q5P01_012156 [Channa striata]